MPSALVSALTTLGLTPYHFTEAVRHNHNKHFDLWLDALKTKSSGRRDSLQRQDFDHILWQYDAVTDAPACFFVEELLAFYPEARVILSTRTPESWAKSIQSTLVPLSTWRSWSILVLFDRTFSAPYWSLFEFIMRLISPNKPADELTSSDLGRYYRRHCAFIREVVPKDRLLEFNTADSWGPLCQFLEVPVPDEEFSHINDTPSS